MSKVLAIVNPAAGGGKCGQRAPEVLDRLRTRGLVVEVAETQKAGDATRIAREAFENGQDRFISVGGDGTGYEVINGLFPLCLEKGRRPCLGFLPLGTGNSFLKDFTQDGEAHAMEALLEERHRPCDVIRLTHQDGELYFINILSFGFVAEVCEKRNTRFRSLGELGYIFGVFSEVMNLKPRHFPIRVDQQETEKEPVTFLSINNSRFTGGKMMMAPHADTNDGLADLIHVGKMGRMKLLRAFPRIFKGSHLSMKEIRETKVREIDFDMQEKVAAMIDGEVAHLIPKRVEVLAGALEVNA